MTKFLNRSLLILLFSFFLSACSNGAEDRNAFLSSLSLLSMADEPDPEDNTNTINIALEVDLVLDPVFDPRTKTYTAKANCVTDSVDVLGFAAYPRLDLTVNDITPETNIKPVNITTPFGTTNVTINLSGENYIATTYNLTITRGDPNDPPAIRLLGDLVVNHTLDVTYSEAGFKACDTNNTDISNVVDVAGDIVLSGTLGTYFVTYDVTDSNNQQATQVTRTVNVVENTAAVITLNGNTTETVTQGAVYDDAGATALDPQEGDITASITSNGTDIIDTSSIDTFTVTYDVIDAGNLAAPQVTRTVEVVAP